MDITPEHGGCSFELAGERVRAQQHPAAFPFLTQLLAAHKFKRIIEIGTASGGLAWWLRHHSGLPVTTYDIVDLPFYAKLRAAGINAIQGDVFAEPNIAYIREALQAPGKALLLCDGGNKIHEFNYFADHLKPGDVIMAHDYSDDAVSYHTHTRALWQWWEIQWRDVADACQRTGLAPVAEDGKSALWLAMLKPKPPAATRRKPRATSPA